MHRAAPRVGLWLALSLASASACNRTEERFSAPASEPTPDAATPGDSASAPEPSATAPAPVASAARCVVPLGEPAPTAKKAERCPPDPTGNLELPKGRVIFGEAPGAPAVDVEFARDELSRERGLMYRTELGQSRGMLFSWDSEAPRSFWMRNTCIPLDMLFVAKDGTIAGILEQVPVLNQRPRGVHCPAAHVLEVNAGYVRAHGIKPGMKLTIEG